MYLHCTSFTTQFQSFSYHSDYRAEQLYTASANGQDSEVLDLLGRGVDPDSDYFTRVQGGWTPLMMACYYNNSFTAECLLKWGAKVVARSDLNFTPLHWACFKNSIDCVQVLMDHNSPMGESLCSSI